MSRRAAIGVVIALLIMPGVVALAGVGGLRPLDYLTHPVRTDFALYYRDALVGWQDGWRHMYALSGFDRVTRELGIVNGDPRVVSLSPPVLTWVAAPFALLPLAAGYAAWLLLLGAAVVATWAVGAPGDRRSRAVHLLLAILFVPLLFGFVLGQGGLLVMLGLVLAWRLLKSGRDVAAGATLTLILLKPQLAFVVPVALLLAGRRRACVAFAATVALIAGVVLVVLPIDALVAYAARVAQAGAHPATWKVSNDLTLAGISPRPLAFALGALVLSAAGWIAYRSRDRASGEPRAIVAALLASLLLAPYLHVEDLAILLPAGWLFLRAHPSRPQIVLMAVTYVACDLEAFGGLGLARVFELAWLAWIAVDTVRGSRTGVEPRAAHDAGRVSRRVA